MWKEGVTDGELDCRLCGPPVKHRSLVFCGCRSKSISAKRNKDPLCGKGKKKDYKGT